MICCEKFTTRNPAWQKIEPAKKFQGLLHAPEAEFQILERWTDIASTYSESALKFPKKDKIVPISGLAQHLQEIGRDEYWAGLWQEHLELQVCWWKLYFFLIRRPTQRAGYTVSAFLVLVVYRYQCFNTVISKLLNRYPRLPVT